MYPWFNLSDKYIHISDKVEITSPNYMKILKNISYLILKNMGLGFNCEPIETNSKVIMFKNGMRPVHPGEVLLEDYIKPMGISVRALSLALHVPYSRLREIVDGKRGVSADTALRLERYFGSEAQGWLNLQAAYDLRIAEKQSAKAIFKEIAPLALAC